MCADKYPGHEPIASYRLSPCVKSPLARRRHQGLPFSICIFGNYDGRRTASLAGAGQRVDLTLVLGPLVVRDIGDELRLSHRVHDEDWVHAADLYRAIAEMTITDIQWLREPSTASISEINA